ncbi:MAG TPA: hypothetical protein VFY27_02365 [Woeseiaceae bacterium]|nr:hypothetical protein [Woeseiaceae bacterium]
MGVAEPSPATCHLRRLAVCIESYTTVVVELDDRTIQALRGLAGSE